MLTLDDVLKMAAAYRSGRVGFQEFADWFEDHSAEAYADAATRDTYAAIEGAFAQYYFDHTGEPSFREQLDSACLDVELTFAAPEKLPMTAQHVESELALHV